LWQLVLTAFCLSIMDPTGKYWSARLLSDLLGSPELLCPDLACGDRPIDERTSKETNDTKKSSTLMDAIFEIQVLSTRTVVQMVATGPVMLCQRVSRGVIRRGHLSGGGSVRGPLKRSHDRCTGRSAILLPRKCS
jgi:hypothetical protein